MLVVTDAGAQIEENEVGLERGSSACCLLFAQITLFTGVIVAL